MIHLIIHMFHTSLMSFISLDQYLTPNLYNIPNMRFFAVQYISRLSLIFKVTRSEICQNLCVVVGEGGTLVFSEINTILTSTKNASLIITDFLAVI